VNGENLKLVNSVKFLGLIIDNKMKWEEHISNKCIQISKAIAVISKLKHILPNRILITLYNSLIIPHMTYGVVAWGNTCTTQLKRMFILQKRAIRIINSSKYNSHSMPIFKQLKLLMLNDLFHLECCKLFAKYFLNLLPDYIAKQLSPNTTQHSYSTRNTLNILPPLVKNKQEEQLVKYKIAKSWNALPNTLKEFHQNPTSIRIFCKLFRDHKFNTYSFMCQTENCYACNNER
jgi:hypothetical protein